MAKKIRIKPENKGKFNSTKKRTGKSTEELTHSKNPVTRKRAVFAQNAAKKWNHAQDGATMPKQEDFLSLEDYYAAMDAYYSSITDLQSEQERTLIPGIQPNNNPLQTSTSRFQDVLQQAPTTLQSFQNRNMSQPTAIGEPKGKKKFNWGQTALTALALTNAVLPQDPIKKPVVYPKQSYNPHPYGTGSQALAEDGITLSKTGYKANSKDRNKPSLRIPSRNITMDNVPHPVLGVDSLGNQQIMMPGENYQFPGEYVDEFPLAKKGKKMKKPGQYISNSYESGGKLQIEDNQFEPISDSTLQIGGSPHAKGGTKLAYAGKGVEAEAGETFHIDPEGNGIIMGNMSNPLTGNKFKNDSKMLAKKEKKVDKLLDYSTELVTKSNPYDKWDALKFNAGEAMMVGAHMKKQELQRSRQHLTDLQEAMLALKFEDKEIPLSKKEGRKEAKKGLKIDFTEKAQIGMMIPFQLGKKKAAQTNNVTATNSTANPLSPVPSFDVYTSPASSLDPDRYLAAIYSNEGGETGVDPSIKGHASGKYALMPVAQQEVFNDHYKNKMSWEEFKKGYDTNPSFEYEVARHLAEKKIKQNKTAAQALASWYHPDSAQKEAWDVIPSPEYGNKISVGEYVNRASNNYFGGKNQKNPNSIYGPSGQANITNGVNVNPLFTTPQKIGRVSAPLIPNQPANTTTTKTNDYKYNWNLKETPEPYVGTDAEPLQFQQILPEIYAAATNKQEPVWMQQYNPQLFQDYEVSLQDRRNQITSQGRATRQYLADNAGAQAILAAGEYDALNQVGAEEFRLNQQISNDITNKNISLLNEAQTTNLRLADQQYTRQALGKSKTKAANQTILNSLSNKVLQNQLENRTLQVYENLYPHFRYNDQYQQEKVGLGGGEYLNTGVPTLQPSQTNYTSTTKIFDDSGTLKQTKQSNPSIISSALQRLRKEELERKNIQKLFNIGK